MRGKMISPCLRSTKFLRNGSLLSNNNIMKGVIVSAFLLVGTFVIFPYVGMILSVTCKHNRSTAIVHRDGLHTLMQDNETNPLISVSVLEEKASNNFAGVLESAIQQYPVYKQNASITEIMEDQAKQLSITCSSNNANTTVYDNRLVANLYHHLLVDDSRKLLFCYVPKVACSNWKRVFLIFAGLVNPSEPLRPSIDIFRKVKSLEDYTPSEQEYRLRNYFKFMFVRNPSERLVSAYRNKIEHPNTDNPSEQTLWDDIRSKIVEQYRGETFTHPPYPTFSEFVNFLGKSDIADMNEHYKPMTALCQPCAVNYHYIGNFATLRQDADKILQHLHVDTTWFWDRGRHYSNPTHDFVEKYYSQLTVKDIELIEKKFLADDIELYKHLFK